MAGGISSRNYANIVTLEYRALLQFTSIPANNIVLSSGQSKDPWVGGFNCSERTTEMSTNTKQKNKEEKIGEGEASMASLQTALDQISKAPASSDAEQPKRKSLCGAAKKRLKYLKAQGMPKEEALEAALRKIDPKKRARTETNTPPVSKVTKRPKGEGPLVVPSTYKTQVKAKHHGKSSRAKSMPYATVAQLVKMTIAAQDFPNTLLTTLNMDAIADVLEDTIAETTSEEIHPRFNQITYKSGYMVLTCMDLATAKWLKPTVPKLSPWAEAKLWAL